MVMVMRYIPLKVVMVDSDVGGNNDGVCFNGV